MGKDSPDVPEAPNPQEAYEAQAKFNRIDYFTPFGSLTYSGPNNTTAEVRLSPIQQAILRQRQGVTSTLGGLAQALAGAYSNRTLTGQETPQVSGGGGGGVPQPAPTFDRAKPLFDYIRPEKPEFEPFQAPYAVVPEVYSRRAENYQEVQQMEAANRAARQRYEASKESAMEDYAEDISQYKLARRQFGLQMDDYQQARGSYQDQLAAYQQQQQAAQQQQQGGQPQTLPAEAGQGNPKMDGDGILFGIPETAPVAYQDYAEAREQAAEAVFESGMNRLGPVFEQQQETIEQRLANRGLPIGSEAYEDAYSAYRRNRAEQLENLENRAYLTGQSAQQQAYEQALQSRRQQIQEALLERTQPLNEISALLGQGQIRMPQFGGTRPVDIMAPLKLRYKGQLAQYEAGAAQNQSFINGLFKLGGAAIGGFFGGPAGATAGAAAGSAAGNWLGGSTGWSGMAF